jgi:hypothetical protein
MEPGGQGSSRSRCSALSSNRILTAGISKANSVKSATGPGIGAGLPCLLPVSHASTARAELASIRAREALGGQAEGFSRGFQFLAGLAPLLMTAILRKFFANSPSFQGGKSPAAGISLSVTRTGSPSSSGLSRNLLTISVPSMQTRTCRPAHALPGPGLPCSPCRDSSNAARAPAREKG